MIAARVILAAAVAVTLAPGCKSEPAATRDRQAEVEPEPARAAEPTPPGKPAEPGFRQFGTAGEALGHILAVTDPVADSDAHVRPRVIGLGEFHQTTGSLPVRSAIERFIDELDVATRGASDLIVETWVEAGACGEREAVVSKDVREVTRRPPVVENHVLRLLSGAKKRGLTPHVLKLTCDDYEYLSADGGEVDYEKMLGLIKRKLAEVAALVYDYRSKQGGDPRTILIYGGALHNDLHPHEGLEFMSYAADITALVGEGYVEIDLYVPEYIAGNALLSQQPWYPVFEREAGPDRVLVFERSPRSYILIFGKGVRAEPAPGPAPQPPGG
jgi:hypothetical protein